MSFKQWLLNEVPLSDTQFIGKWGDKDPKYGYKKSDIGILTQPNIKEKLKKSWSNSKYDFDLYFVKSFKAMQHVELGERSKEWVKENLDLDLTPKEDHITIIFTQNKATPHMPMTPWIIAHRISHAVRQNRIFEEYITRELKKDFSLLLKDIYGIEDNSRNHDYPLRNKYNKDMKALAQEIGSFRSARKKEIRNFYEFAHEMIAQWIITGKVEFNPPPASFIRQARFAWGNPAHDYAKKNISGEDFEDIKYYVSNMAEKYEMNILNAFSGFVNKIFVM